MLNQRRYLSKDLDILGYFKSMKVRNAYDLESVSCLLFMILTEMELQNQVVTKFLSIMKLYPKRMERRLLVGVNLSRFGMVVLLQTHL